MTLQEQKQALLKQVAEIEKAETTAKQLKIQAEQIEKTADVALQKKEQDFKAYKDGIDTIYSTLVHKVTQDVSKLDKLATQISALNKEYASLHESVSKQLSTIEKTGNSAVADYLNQYRTFDEYEVSGIVIRSTETTDFSTLPDFRNDLRLLQKLIVSMRRAKHIL